jgi:GTP pyrophosphokinase
MCWGQEVHVQENRESFLGRLRPILAPSDVRRVHLAYMMAKTVHHGQTRSETDVFGDPVRYFEHLRRSALTLIDRIGIRDSDMICALLLHDSVEDSKLEPDMIEQFLGREVVRTVVCVTKDPEEGYEERLLEVGDWRVLADKLCDRDDNLLSLWACPAEKQARKIAETKAKYDPIWDRLMALAPREHSAGLVRIVGGVRRIVREYELDGRLPPPPYTPPE